MKIEPSDEDPLVYVPQEVQIPLGKDGLPGPWCMYHKSSGHSIDDCRQLNECKKRPKSDKCYTCGEPGHISRDCPRNEKPKRAKKKSSKTFTSTSTQTEDLDDVCSTLTQQRTQESQRMTAVSWDQTFVYKDLPGEEWDLQGHNVVIHPGPSGPPQKYWIARLVASGSRG